MFTTEEREQLQNALIAAAKADPRVVAAALVGSSALGFRDRWSDIDLALGIAAGIQPDAVAQNWTDRIYREHAAITHVDVWSDGTRFRVFLLPGTLQLDVAFWTESKFGATGPHFSLLFGEAKRHEAKGPSDAGHVIGMAWLYALHARSSIARGRIWQAEHMIRGMRDQVLALICLRHGLVAAQARGIDDVPPEETAPLSETIARSLDAEELHRAFSALCSALLSEAGHHDSDLANRLAEPLRDLTLDGAPSKPVP